MPLRRLFVLAWVSVIVAAAPAGGDVLFTPFVGANLNGTATSPIGTLLGDASRTTFGASVAVMGGGVFGVEADIGHSPRFFGSDIEIGNVPISLARNDVTTAMVNLTVGVPIQGRSGVGVRPYGVAGVGLIRQRLELAGGLFDRTASDFGYDVGGGVMLFLGRHVGLRGDLRHFRTAEANPLASLVDLDVGSFNFTRATVGLTLRY